MVEVHLHEHDSSTREACASCETSGMPRPTFRSGRAYQVRGLDCAEEVAVLRQAVGPVLGGADRLAFDVLNGRMTVAEEAREVSEQAILEAIASTGMSATAWTPS
jgi:Cd2+/Zn2+-exporting ATPase